MIKEIKTEQFEGLLVLGPKFLVSAAAYMGYIIFKYWNEKNGISTKDLEDYGKTMKYLENHNPDKEHKDSAMKLPEGEFKVVGIVAKLTDEQRLEVIKSDEWPMVEKGQHWWQNFEYDDAVTKSISESFDTFLESNEVYLEHPNGERPVISDPDPESQYFGAQMDSAYAWEEMDKLVGDWVLLKKIA